MNQLSLFLIETFIGIFVSGVVIIALLKPLRKILIDICGNAERAGFWVVYSNVMLVIAPLLTIIMFGKSNASLTADFTFYKTAFGCSLFGIFFSLAAIGLQVSKFIPKNINKSNAEDESI